MADLSGVKLHLVNSVDEASAFMSWIGERRPHDVVGVDTETGELPGNPVKDAFNPWRGQLRLVQVGDGQTAWAIPWDGWNGVFHEAMTKYEGQIVCHNIAFEARWFGVKSRFELPWHRAHDTMIQAHIIDPLGSGALKTLTSKHVDYRAAHLQQQLDDGMAKNGWTWGTVPIEFQPYWVYGALDCILTVRLWEKFNADCGTGGRYAQVYDLEMATRRVCTQMELGGARIDLDYSAQKYQELHDYAERVKAWGRETFGGKSLSSNLDLARIFENEYGAEITEFTPGGSKKVDKDQLKKFTIQYPGTKISALAETVLSMRKAAKLAETYFINFNKFAVDGLVHPNVRTLGARTSRMSITEPALQTLNKGEKTVRRAFIPRNDDEVIITSDLDQVEFRMTAALSGDQGLIDLFNRCDATGGDAFTEIMREVYDDPSLQRSDSRRKLIKGCVPLTSEILTRRGWLAYDEVKTGDETLGYNFATGRSEWTEITGVHVYDDSEIYRLSNSHKSFLCTDDHRWIADDGRAGSERRFIRAHEMIPGQKRLVLAAPAADGDIEITDKEARILGWILGDGSIKRSALTGATSQGTDGRRRGCEMSLSQTKTGRIEEIDHLLRDVPHIRGVTKRGQTYWTFNPDWARNLLHRVGIESKQEFDPWQVALGLPNSARQLMIDTLNAADGKSENGIAIVQLDRSPVAELLMALGYLTGKYARRKTHEPDGKGWMKSTCAVVYHGLAHMTHQRAKLEYVETGRVWCVTTELQSWTMRQPDEDGTPVLTGNTVYGKLYGAGAAKMALTAGVPETQMKAVIDAFDSRYPGVRMFSARIEDEGMRRQRSEGQGYVLTQTGRRLPCDEGRVYSLTNYAIQGGAAEVFKLNMLKCDAAGLTPYLCVPVHDELVASVPKVDVDEFKATLKECMTTTDGWNVPLTAGCDGPFANWGEAVES